MRTIEPRCLTSHSRVTSAPASTWYVFSEVRIRGSETGDPESENREADRPEQHLRSRLHQTF